VSVEEVLGQNKKWVGNTSKTRWRSSGSSKGNPPPLRTVQCTCWGGLSNQRNRKQQTFY